jgi:Glycosyl hydrolases family 16
MIKYISVFPRLLLVGLLTFSGCKQPEYNFGAIEAPMNLSLTTSVVGVDAQNPNGNGTGSVIINTTANNALTYKIDFGDGNTPQVVPSGKITYRYANPGTMDYTITVSAIGTGGAMSTMSKKVKVFVAFEVPSDILALLTNNSSQVWVSDKDAPGHVGVGPTDSFSPIWYSAEPNTRPACLYDDEITFTKAAGNSVTLTVDNKGQSSLIGAATAYYGLNGGDNCYALATGGAKPITFMGATSASTTSNSTRIQFTVPGNGIVNFGTGGNTYEILALSASSISLRSIGADGNAWYTKLKPKGATGQQPERKLIWSEEFDKDGAPNTAVWGYDLGNGDNGWGNAEKQYYTNRPDNVVVKDGILTITAKKETLNGFGYTSARLQTANKFAFTYGRVEIRAKLPTGGGTWPALWMLGSNFATAGWPACGEIDMMEAKGNEPNKIHGTLHYPGRSGGNADTGSTTISNASTEFHIYSVDWSATSIKMYIDGNLFQTFPNNSTLPFNKDFFLILNVAMGGTFGGTIDPGFVSSSMDVDYIRVYQ